MIKKREIGLEELKEIQLGILDDVAMFCEKNESNWKHVEFHSWPSHVK